MKGEVQASASTPSTRQRNSRRLVAQNVIVGAVAFVGSLGPLSIVVLGAVVSTVKLREAGVSSTFCAA